ncbi:MAG: FtsX-like permease family protein [Spirochaetaceae bacterium]|jgi:putative ABC transport system permease protein|nr:FtsX-like permease family protein [Spirochaetaceae bacterium]
MQKMNLTTGGLSLKNLRAKPVRTACLVVVAAILAFALFGGSILALNLQQGLATMTKRFGADLMVVPTGASEKAQSLLLHGGANYFYFDAAIADKVSQTEGVVCASPQFFLTSLATDCCDAAVQLIAYDPATDFVVQPWIAEKHSGQVRDGQVVVGSRIALRPNGTIQLFSHEYPVAAQLSSSASGFDISVFMTMNTMRDLIGRARSEGYNFLSVQEKEAVRNRVSAILVKTDSAKAPSLIASNIRKQNEGVDVLVSQGIFARIAASLSGLVNYIRLFSLALWVLAVIVLAAVFSGIMHERKKEFALLRILGATRRRLVGMVLGESFIAGIAGGVAGIALASLAVFPFSTLLSERLELPYLDAPPSRIMLFVAGSLFLSALVGPLASLYAALRMSRAETYFTMREGE